MKSISLAVCMLLASPSVSAQNLFVKNEMEVTDSFMNDTSCKAPGVCVPPETKFSQVSNVVPRKQWEISGGFCGATSIQAITQNFGAYISVDLVRKHTPYEKGGHGNPKDGYEVLPGNIGPALDSLKIKHELFDHDNIPQPQSQSYLKWIKKKLAADQPVVTFVMCKGDSHDAYGLGPFDHIEPVFGLYSNHPLSDPEIYDDDYLVHGSDYSPDGVKNLGYFRKFNSMVDTVKMDGNCKNAQAPHTLNEAYPCFNDQLNWGAAITGLYDPKGVTLPLSLWVDNWKEPNVRTGEKPIEMTATILVKGLTPGEEYVVYMFESNEAYPSDSLFHDAPHKFKYPFKAEKDTFKFTAPDKIMSNEMAYYVCVPAKK